MHCEVKMLESTLTIKGQTTLPKDIRDGLNLSAGDRIRYVMLDDGQVRLLKVGSVQRLAGILFDPNRKIVSLEDMEAVIAERAVE